jgi:hypothetical protein
MGNQKRAAELCCVWVAFLFVAWSAAAQSSRPLPTRILAKPRAGVLREQTESFHAQNGLRSHRRYPAMGGLEVLDVPAASGIQALLERYRKSPLIEYAESDWFVRGTYTPNEPRFADGSLWNLHNTGAVGGKVDADIDAREAWDLQRDASGIIVAVIDTGVRYTHQDIAANMWRNSAEIPNNGIDDDGDGYFSDVYGINAISGSGDPMDVHGHGTHVAGIIGAVGDNGLGSVGVAMRVQLMGLKLLNTNMYGTVSDAIECINYARVKGARIINASWGDYNDFTSQALRDAIASARDAGIIFVAAAGNESGNNDSRPFYPASYDLDNIISVAATTRNDDLASFSCYGPRTVHLGAPGDEVYSTWGANNSAYRNLSGTSMAAPHVAGACALVWARFPWLTYREVIQQVLNNVDPLPSLAGITSTGGRLNLYKALTRNSGPVLGSIGNKITSEGVTLIFTATASDADGGPLTFSLAPGAPSGATIDPASGLFSWTPDETQGGTTNVITIRVTDSPAGAGPPLSDSETITVVVNEVNVRPVLRAIGNKFVNEGTTLVFTAAATDPEGGPLTFSLDPGAPSGAMINSATGVFSWTPNENQGGTMNVITVRVTDIGSPPLSDSETITIAVNEVNTHPTLDIIPDQTNSAGSMITFTATASDPDLPANALTFTLDPGAPAGSAITSNGLFTWSPTDAQAPGTHLIGVRVTDNGSPPLQDSRVVRIVVYERPRILAIQPVGPNSVALAWSSIPGKTYRVQAKDSFDATVWNDVAEIQAAGVVTSITNNLTMPGRFFRVTQTN